MTKEPSSTTPCTIRKSRARIDCTVTCPRPGHANTVSTITAPASRFEISSAGDRDDGDRGVAREMPKQQSIGAHAAGARGAHIVLGQLVEQRGARDARECRHAQQPKREGRHDRGGRIPPVEEGGSQPRVTAKIMISRMPLQKVGMLCAASTKPAQSVRTALSRHIASAMPTGMPTPQRHHQRPPASASV